MLENSFTITYSGCKQEVAVNPQSPFEVNYEVFIEDHPSLIGQAEGDAVLTLTVEFPKSTRPADCPLTYDIQADTPQGVSLTLEEDT